MTDVLTREQRSRCMSNIRGRDTKPELLVRRVVYKLGYRFRLHVRNLPGCPDIVFKSRHKVIFVHGCFWHMHSCNYGIVVPKTNAAFWEKKRYGNVERDRSNIAQLEAEKWCVLIVWECETKDIGKLKNVLSDFLSS